MVEETFKYVATPDDNATATAAWSRIQTCREVYNHALTQEYRPRPDYDKPSYREMQNGLTGSDGWKDRWPEWKRVYSKCLQMAVRRIKQSEHVLAANLPTEIVDTLNEATPEHPRDVASYAEALTEHKEREARLEEDADDADVEERPNDLPDDVPAKATITIKEINDNRYYYWQWREGDKVTSKYKGPVNPDG